ncbi:nuclear body protein SP140-like isoform X1 [Eptesicus fuscus]|uniref:nuclear body protein SP140-like isoform X1 n=1 Tax=Eptesicus fuscus TaxID=29078 RepID=UPI002403BFA2|nr:nuclear body protein SP140-like isoform X1 [Eptesicus fuscus]
MASGGTDLSTRMSAEDENIENKRINDIALTYFKKYKVEISGAIKTTFPFLELLRDHEFITNEMYEKSQESFKKRFSVHEVIYDVLTELEKKFDMSLLGALFSKTIMKNYPDLFRIYKIFYKVLPDIEFLLESDGEENAVRPNEQLSLEQGTGETSYQRLMWLGPDACNYNDTAPPERGSSEHLRETQEINATETCTTSDNRDALESQQANEQCAQQSKTAVINSQDFTEFTDGDGPSEASTSALKRKIAPIDFRKSPTAGKILCKTGIREPMDANVDFGAEILPVTCGEITGLLIKRKFERGSMVKCIRSQDGNWFTLHEFELKAGYKSCNWKNSMRCDRRTLKWLMEKELLPKPPRIYGKIKKPENADKCKICGDEGKLFKCSWCFSFFHGDCHIPPVEPERKPWRCTFCTILQVSSRSQQCYSESEVLARQMGPEEKSKCEFLLLKAYCHFETNIFPNIPHQNYVQKASQCLETLRTLDEIKNNLKKSYSQVKGFVLDMNNIFQDSKHNNSDLIKEEFKKNFKEVFAIQKTNQNSSLV